MSDDDSSGIFVFIPGKLVNFLNTHTHWSLRYRYNRDWREKVQIVFLEANATYKKGSPESRTPKVVRLHAMVFNRFDGDGLQAALKPVLDGLQDAGLIHSDRDDSGHTIRYSQTVNRRQPGVEIGIGLA